MTAAAVFWFAVAMIVYHHVGYPILLKLLARRRRRRAATAGPAADTGALPSVTIIVPCHNEAAVIADKVENLAALEYPRERLSVVIVLDGCTDATKSALDAALAALQDKADWQIVEYERNVGKVTTLNEQIARAASGVVALSDASALVSPDALLRAARYFARPDIGVVCGSYQTATEGNPGEQAYWAYQSRVKLEESLVAAPMGAHGAFYLFRRDLWSALPVDTINDDFILPMRIVLKGYRAVYDPAIVASDLERSAAGHEFSRRIRIGAGNLQQVLRLPGLGNPRRGLLAFIFLSGKGLRAVMPLFLLAAFLATVVLATQGSGWFGALLAGEIAVVAVAVAGLYLPQSLVPRPLKVLTYFLMGHAATAVGCILLIVGQGRKVWRFSSSAKTSAADVTLDPKPQSFD
jgi:cellulose synthase/poly-beta-1,6-N-acetylglucosamine synthase-like glycosyltransferase